MEKRRSPFKKRPFGTVKGTTRQLDLLDLLQTYELLPADYLMAAYDKPEGAQRLITLLNHNGYIGIVEASTRHMRVYNRPKVYELTPKGIQLLKDKDRWRDRVWERDHFLHKFLRTLVQFSFDIAPKEVPGLTLRTLEDILAHPRCPDATRHEERPSYFVAAGHQIRPDGELFGYELNRRYFYLHGHEDDRGTETRGRSNIYGKKTITAMIRGYAEYLDQGMYQTRYGIRNVSIPIICTTYPDLLAIFEVIKREVPSEQWPRFLGKVIPDFTSMEPFPKPTGHMFTEDWLRPDGSRFNIHAFMATGEPTWTSTEPARSLGKSSSAESNLPLSSA
jgi:hypothetical protein